MPAYDGLTGWMHVSETAASFPLMVQQWTSSQKSKSFWSVKQPHFEFDILNTILFCWCEFLSLWAPVHTDRAVMQQQLTDDSMIQETKPKARICNLSVWVSVFRVMHYCNSLLDTFSDLICYFSQNVIPISKTVISVLGRSSDMSQ